MLIVSSKTLLDTYPEVVENLMSLFKYKEMFIATLLRLATTYKAFKRFSVGVLIKTGLCIALL